MNAFGASVLAAVAASTYAYLFGCSESLAENEGPEDCIYQAVNAALTAKDGAHRWVRAGVLGTALSVALNVAANLSFHVGAQPTVPNRWAGWLFLVAAMLMLPVTEITGAVEGEISSISYGVKKLLRVDRRAPKPVRILAFFGALLMSCGGNYLVNLRALFQNHAQLPPAADRLIPLDLSRQSAARLQTTFIGDLDGRTCELALADIHPTASGSMRAEVTFTDDIHEAQHVQSEIGPQGHFAIVLPRFAIGVGTLYQRPTGDFVLVLADSHGTIRSSMEERR